MIMKKIGHIFRKHSMYLNEIIQKIYPENMKKIVGAVWKLPAK